MDKRIACIVVTYLIVFNIYVISPIDLKLFMLLTMLLQMGHWKWLIK